MRMLTYVWIAALALPAFAAKGNLEGLDTSVDELLRAWQVPGVAIVVVDDGKVILSKGYGLRNVKDNQPVTPRTLFAIGSSTKSFTVSVLGTLVDEGKLDWDK